MPEPMLAYVEHWKELMPEFKFICWNESNFEAMDHPWIQKTISAGLYAFASDFVRFWVLNKYGGIYLDTDVELKKSLAPFLSNSSFLSFEFDSFMSTCIIGAVKNHVIISKLLDKFDSMSEYEVSNSYVTRYFIDNYPEFRLNNQEQSLGDSVHIYPKEYFVVPSFDDTHNYALHHAANQWNPATRKGSASTVVRNVIGDVLFYKLVNLRMNWNSEFKQRERARRNS